MATDYLIKLIEQNLQWRVLNKYLPYLWKYRWKPKYIFFDPITKLYIAVDVIFSQQISNKIYETEVTKVLRQNPGLRVCLFSSLDYEYDQLKSFCKKYNFGLKIYDAVSVSTILPFESEKIESVIRKKAKKEGWFPQIILSEAKKVKKIKYKNVIIELINKIEKHRSKEQQLVFIKEAIDKMLKSSPDYIGSNIPFMRLSNFEDLFNFSDIRCKDHVFHSVRVFLIGCIIIDKFYDKLRGYYKEILGTDRISIEYMWLLTSLFHDIGRVKQDAYRIYLTKPGEDNLELKEKLSEELSKRWQDETFKNSMGNIIELIKQSCKRNSKRDKPFVGYALGGPTDEKIARLLRESYNNLKSHGVISCFDLSSDLLGKMKAAKLNNKTFLLYHIFPAVLSIAFHDWKIWKDLTELKVFPINIKNFPMASLLIFIDTWDDYKRDGEEKISIDKLVMDNNQVIVYLTWHKNKDYLDEKLKYDSFERNVIFSDLKLKIEVSNKRK